MGSFAGGLGFSTVSTNVSSDDWTSLGFEEVSWYGEGLMLGLLLLDIGGFCSFLGGGIGKVLSGFGFNVGSGLGFLLGFKLPVWVDGTDWSGEVEVASEWLLNRSGDTMFRCVTLLSPDDWSEELSNTGDLHMISVVRYGCICFLGFFCSFRGSVIKDLRLGFRTGTGGGGEHCSSWFVIGRVSLLCERGGGRGGGGEHCSWRFVTGVSLLCDRGGGKGGGEEWSRVIGGGSGVVLFGIWSGELWFLECHMGSAWLSCEF